MSIQWKQVNQCGKTNELPYFPANHSTRLPAVFVTVLVLFVAGNVMSGMECTGKKTTREEENLLSTHSRELDWVSSENCEKVSQKTAKKNYSTFMRNEAADNRQKYRYFDGVQRQMNQTNESIGGTQDDWCFAMYIYFAEQLEWKKRPGGRLQYRRTGNWIVVEMMMLMHRSRHTQ